MYKNTLTPQRAAPAASSGIIGWLRANLFSGLFSSIFTLLGIYALYLLLVPMISWAFVNADWIGNSREACVSGGACWVFISNRLQQFTYGFYPSNEIWRINLTFVLFVLQLLWLALPRLPAKMWVAPFMVLVFPIIAYGLLYGGWFGLTAVPTHKWGGLTLTLIIAIVGIFAALPIGTLLALGRQSSMPIVRSLSVVFIEFWRGVPLITVLFMSSVMLPLFVPEQLTLDKLVRAMIGIIFFQSAYIAEVVRGGLQAIPKGQSEAAEALGLNYSKTMLLIVLPQALKMMIPGIVNTFIALFKDTSLVLIIGLFDLLAIVQSGLADAKWLGFATEGYVFAALIYWVFCFAMSKYSQHLERTLNTGHRVG